MYIYIEGKEPVSRKSKSLAEMGVNDGDNLIVTTEMKLPFDEISDSDNDVPNFEIGGTMFPAPNIRGIGEMENPYVDLGNNNQLKNTNNEKQGLLTPPNFNG